MRGTFLDYWRFSGELEGSLRVEPGPAIGRPRRPVRIADAITDASYLATIIFSKDPVAINRLYRDLRNIRTHFGERLLEAATTVHLADLHSDGQPGLHRWYLRQLETLNLVGSKHETSVNLKCGSLPIFIGIHRLSLYSVKASTS
jgi:hypothetical protein